MKKQSAFSLIELLVVISIIAVLTTLGLAMYSEVQKRTRDAQRKADITAIAKALEVHYQDDKYKQLSNDWFENGVIPQTDPGGKNYCGCAAATGDPPFGTTGTSGWIRANSCPADNTGGCAAWAQVSTTNPVPAVGGATWRVCALLEAADKVFCKHNVQ